jgi:pimeloyl-ACP methyl ester carboxylesterase
MSDDLPHSIIEVISDAGHSVIGEQPEAAARLVNGFVALPDDR